MKWLLALSTCVAALCAGKVARPCGAPFGSGVSVDPHQDIILVWKDDVETYVFQPTFCGTATDFGLILPVPTPLTQKPALSEQGAFTAAVTLSAPTKVIVEADANTGCIASGAEDSKSAQNAGPTVVASGRVGFLDWVQLKAETTASFTDWLSGNGYPYTPAAVDVFASYVEKGWYFVAFRISQQAIPGSGTICQALGPVALTFPSPTPVVPSRMATASVLVGSSYARFAWRIFGITGGDRELAFAGAARSDKELVYSGAIPADDVPAFAGLARVGDRLTRLLLTFDGHSTEPDVGLTLASPRDFRGTQEVYVYDDASCSVGRNGTFSRHLPSIVLGVALTGLLVRRRRRRR
jgi:hypothetical protein